MPLLLLAIPIVSTLIGGVLALRLQRHISVLIAVGAGILLGAAFLDLLPEALTIGSQAGLSSYNVLALTLLSFLLFHGLDSSLEAIARRHCTHSFSKAAIRRSNASLLVFHSLRDGMAIGAAYAASHDAGYAVALGIAAHDIGDGMNVVLLAGSGEMTGWGTYLFLAADALAPFIGGLLTIWWSLSLRSSVSLLVSAAGFFLQVATGDFFPELKRVERGRRFLLPSVLLGAAVIYLANCLLGENLQH